MSHPFEDFRLDNYHDRLFPYLRGVGLSAEEKRRLLWVLTRAMIRRALFAAEHATHRTLQVLLEWKEPSNISAADQQARYYDPNHETASIRIANRIALEADNNGRVCMPLDARFNTINVAAYTKSVSDAAAVTARYADFSEERLRAVIGFSCWRRISDATFGGTGWKLALFLMFTVPGAVYSAIAPLLVLVLAAPDRLTLHAKLLGSVYAVLVVLSVIAMPFAYERVYELCSVVFGEHAMEIPLHPVMHACRVCCVTSREYSRSARTREELRKAAGAPQLRISRRPKPSHTATATATGTGNASPASYHLPNNFPVRLLPALPCFLLSSACRCLISVCL